MRYVTISPENEGPIDVLALSTEDGRIIFYSTVDGLDKVPADNGSGSSIPTSCALGQLGGIADGIPGRVKDFEFLRLPSKEGSVSNFVIIAGSSDGSIRVWTLAREDFHPPSDNSATSTNGHNQIPLKKNDKQVNMVEGTPSAARQIGTLVGTYDTGYRITCLKAFVMVGSPSEEDPASEPEDPNGFGEDVQSSDGSGSD